MQIDIKARVRDISNERESVITQVLDIMSCVRLPIGQPVCEYESRCAKTRELRNCFRTRTPVISLPSSVSVVPIQTLPPTLCSHISLLTCSKNIMLPSSGRHSLRTDARRIDEHADDKQNNSERNSLEHSLVSVAYQTCV